MKKGSAIGWTLFAWIVGGIFLLSGLCVIIFKIKIYDNPPIFGIEYNLATGLGATAIGVAVLARWFKDRKKE